MNLILNSCNKNVILYLCLKLCIVDTNHLKRNATFNISESDIYMAIIFAKRLTVRAGSCASVLGSISILET